MEYWEVVERKISIRWGTYGAHRAEKQRHDYVRGDFLGEDLRRAARMAESIPVILGFVAVLVGILTALFSIETLVTILYTGPFHQHIVSGALSDDSLGLTTFIHFRSAFSWAFPARCYSWLPPTASSGCTRRSPPG